MTAVFIVTLAAFFFLKSASTADDDGSVGQPRYPVGDFRNCLLQKGVNRFEALPGGGWDNLRNVDMGQVAFMNYSQCLMTEDGQYLIPDTTYAVPQKRSQVETFGELIEHWSNYTSITSSSINADASFFSVVSGSFSDEHQSIKKHQVNDKSITTRVMLRHHMYSIRMEPDTQLHPKFKARLMDIAAHIANNNTKMADYLLQLVVRDYGTHVVTAVEAGATLAQVDQIKSTFSSDYENQKSAIKASASASFFGKIGLGGGFSHSTSETFSNEYLSNRTYSKILTYGGPPYRVNFTINLWEDGINNGLVAIDRAGDPLHFVVTPQNMPEIPQPTLIEVITGLEKMINRYYKFNTYRGCTNQDSENFNFQANLDDDSCKAPSTNFTFGGVYQTCSMRPGSNAGDLCGEIAQKNPLSGDYSCPAGYESIYLNEGTMSKNYKRWQCHRSCHRCWLVATCCHDECGNAYYSSAATYKAYWCAATGEVQQNSGFLFGGIFTKTSSNPLTKTQGCPVRFYPLRLGEFMRVCVSDDYELGYRYSVPFAGFFSCRTGNPLVFNSHLKSQLKSSGELSLSGYVHASGPGSWPHRCPSGYSQHLATVDANCEIDYCVKANALIDQGLPNVRRPPFNPLPGLELNQTDLLFIIGPAKRVWVKNDSTQLWSRSSFTELEKLHLMEKQEVVMDKTTDGGQVAGVTIGVTAFVGLIVVIAFLGWRRHTKHVSLYRKRDDGLELDNVCSKAPYGTFREDSSTSLNVDDMPAAQV
ncbi:macrophage-expressed gene 1 protein-like [Lineus longissimus]|uniref:macrophage-expressed gene 1 protein-like n=1 Tax=Lineus longissimus TaxID=88925 RepID=UPI00315CE3AB